MEYSIQKLSKMAGVSSRTLRYYDEIGILKPARVNSSGYRVYGRTELDRLQQILFYRELGLSLEGIREIVTAPGFDTDKALKEHHARLLDKRQRLDLLIATVAKTIAASEGRIAMRDSEKFEGFKQKMIDDNEKNYGEEARAKYGDDKVDQANQKIKGMSKEQYAELESLSSSLSDTLKAAMADGDPGGELGQKAAQLHRQWLGYFWDSYSKEAHAGLAQMYVADERFASYYDKIQPGAAAFLRDAILIYTGMKN
ncbi:MAG: MerR family transcriptional regulator [Syntrophomonadaceae bacterium]